MIKAIREAKVHTSWVNINDEYEEAIRKYIRKIFSDYEYSWGFSDGGTTL